MKKKIIAIMRVTIVVWTSYELLNSSYVPYISTDSRSEWIRSIISLSSVLMVLLFWTHQIFQIQLELRDKQYKRLPIMTLIALFMQCMIVRFWVNYVLDHLDQIELFTSITTLLPLALLIFLTAYDIWSEMKALPNITGDKTAQ